MAGRTHFIRVCFSPGFKLDRILKEALSLRRSPFLTLLPHSGFKWDDKGRKHIQTALNEQVTLLSFPLGTSGRHNGVCLALSAPTHGARKLEDVPANSP